MTLADLAEQVAAADPKLTKAQAKALIQAVFAAIRDSAIDGNEVALAGFGKFRARDTPARRGRNPATGASIIVPASRKVVFQPSKALKSTVGRRDGTSASTPRRFA